MVADSSQHELYDHIADTYADYSEKQAAYLERVESIVLSQLNPKTKLLDIGTGDGRRLSKLLKKSGVQDYVCIEPSQEMARIARDKYKLSVVQSSIEDYKPQKDRRFDVITFLWNVLGHIPSPEERVSALTIAKQNLSQDGVLLLDVNNRHNASAYGYFKVLMRRFLDRLSFNASRGDAFFHWTVGGKQIPAYGHLFIPQEMRDLVSRAGLQFDEVFSVHYQTGDVSSDLTQGQLFYKLSRAD